MNADWAQVIINSLIVLIYFLMLRSNIKMMKGTKQMAEETKNTRQQAYRPEVIAYIREENEALYFRVQNVGTRPAFDIHLYIENYFYNTEHEGKKDRHNMFFEQSPNSIRDVEKIIYFLAPNQSIESYMGIREDIIKRNLNIKRNVTITYFNYEREIYIEEYALSTDDFIKKSYYKKDNLETISYELKEIKSKINKTKDF